MFCPEQWLPCGFKPILLGLVGVLPLCTWAQKKAGRIYEAKSEAKAISIRPNNGTPLIIDWVRPDSREPFITSNNQVELSAKILAEDSVTATQIKLWVNGQLFSGNKSTEVNLFAGQRCLLISKN